MGIEQLKARVVNIAEVLNIFSRVAHGSGVWALVGLVKPAQALLQADFGVLKAEIADCSKEERLDVEAAFKGALDLVNKDVQAKFQGGVDILDEVIDIAAAEVELVKKGIAEVAKVRALLGV